MSHIFQENKQQNLQVTIVHQNNNSLHLDSRMHVSSHLINGNTQHKNTHTQLREAGLLIFTLQCFSDS